MFRRVTQQSMTRCGYVCLLEACSATFTAVSSYVICPQKVIVWFEFNNINIQWILEGVKKNYVL